jgi:hypothetical protein
MGGDLPDFADALRTGIQARGLSLERLQEHLRRRGVSVSLATLSYWQSGRSQPERRESLTAVGGLEEILRLPEGALSSLLLARRYRGRSTRPITVPLHRIWPRPDPVRAAMARLESRWEDQLTRISIQDTVHIGASRAEQSIRVRQVLRAEQDGPDRLLIIFGADPGLQAFPELKIRRPHGLGDMISDLESGFFIAELLFGRALQRGETIITEHFLRHTVTGPQSSNWERRFRYPAREFLVEVRFHPSALPARCMQYSVVEGPERARPVTLDPAHSVHHVALAVPQGRCGIRWEWENS